MEVSENNYEIGYLMGWLRRPPTQQGLPANDDYFIGWLDGFTDRKNNFDFGLNLPHNI